MNSGTKRLLSKSAFVILLVTTFRLVPQQNRDQSSPREFVPPTPLVWPAFEVFVTLSPMAKLKLEQGHESLRVFGYYFDFPKRGAPRKYISDEGEVGLGSFDVEFPLSGHVTISGVRGDAKAFEETMKTAPHLLVNVVSARKSSKNNLLACDIFEDGIDKIQNGRIPIRCKLIGE